MDLRSLLPSNMLSPHEVLPLLFLLHPPPRDLRETLFKTWPRRSFVPTTPTTASYVIDVLIAVIDSEISFVRLGRKKDKIESEKKGRGRERERGRERYMDIWRRSKLAAFFVRVSKRRVSFFAVSSSFLRFVGGPRMDGGLLSRHGDLFRSFFARNETREGLDRIRRLDERHAIGSGRRKTRRQVGRFGERRNAEGRRQEAGPRRCI